MGHRTISDIIRNQLDLLTDDQKKEMMKVIDHLEGYTKYVDELGKATNKEICEKLIVDIWAHMPLFSQEESLLDETIKRLRDVPDAQGG